MNAVMSKNHPPSCLARAIGYVITLWSLNLANNAVHSFRLAGHHRSDELSVLSAIACCLS